jgi:hypothetical protein
MNRLSVSKRATQTFDTQEFGLWKSNIVKDRQQHQAETSKRLAALENYDDEVGIYRVRGYMTENINISAKDSLGRYNLKQHNPWFEEKCSQMLLGRMQYTALHYMHNQICLNIDNRDSVRLEACRIF